MQWHQSRNTLAATAERKESLEMSDVCMIFFQQRSSGVNLHDAARWLAEQGLDVTTGADALTVRWDDGPALRVHLSNAAHVAVEAAEIAEGTEHVAGLAACNARFEIGIDDLDEVLDEMNTLIEVQSALQDATNGYLFNAWNGELTAPARQA
jgi:hypothetical protein